MGPMSRTALLKFVCLGAFLVGFWLWWWWLFVLGFVVVGVSLVGLLGFWAGGVQSRTISVNFQDFFKIMI